MTEPGFLPRAEFPALLESLHRSGYTCVGPQLRDSAIVYDRLTDVSQLPQGVRTVQVPGSYRTHSDGSPRHFSWANGPQALKPIVFKPREVMWTAERQGKGFRFQDDKEDVTPTAVIGVRACDLAALRLQDQHFLDGPYRDKHYAERRAQLLLVAVNCTHPDETCFCASTGDGPEVTQEYDVVLDELVDGFVVRAGTEKGEKIVAELPLVPVSPDQLDSAKAVSERAAQSQVRALPSSNLRNTLVANLEHPRWAEVAKRCLSCGNCTAVCPSCFCHRELDEPVLDGESSQHYRDWSSCFTEGHSYITGLTIRADTHSRYRQWVTHKLGTWHDQYGRSGCVGCGRCITWCPVGIDITEEATAIWHDGRHP